MSEWHTTARPHRRLNTGERGEDVQRFQTALENRSGIAVPNDGVIGPETLRVKRKVFWDLGLPDRDYPITEAAQRNVRWPWTRSPAALQRAKQRAAASEFKIDYSKGARHMVETAVRIAQDAHDVLYVVSDYRPGDPMDHGSNDFDRAARDIAHPQFGALWGPPHPYLDDAVVLIGKAFGRNYQKGVRIVDTFHQHGWRIQIIWHTPEYGGHLGHIHLGINQD
jgi:hypothetical protein